jgi:predicted ATPase
VGLESPMIGRDAQLDTLHQLLPVVAAGRSRTCLVIGEPGIGKSRLLSEFRRSAEEADNGEPARWIEGRCVSYGQNLPYHLLLDLVRSILNLPLPADEVQARSAFDRQLAALLEADEAADIAPYLAHLLALPLGPEEADRAKVSPDVMQQRYSAAVHRLLRAAAGQAPVILVCEDVHWADPASVEVMLALLPLAAQLRVLFIAALRAEIDSAGWKLVTTARQLFGDALTEIQLDPLSEEESRSLVAHLLVIESLPAEVRDLILARAEGNPFFVEEVVRMLVERGLIERRDGRWLTSSEIASVDIPETLHGLLLARIDQLSEPAKHSLRIASVIGRQFPVRVLERVLDSTTG